MNIRADSPEERFIKEQMARQQVENIRNTVGAARGIINPDRPPTPEQPPKPEINPEQMLRNFAAGNFGETE